MKRVARMARHRSARALVSMALTGLAASFVSRRTAPFGPERRIGRGALIKLGGLGLTALATATWRRRSAMARRSSSPTARAVTCVLTPEQTEGPYYIPGEKVRKDITEHKPGTPLVLRLTVVDAATCQPLKGAAVDVWHCDATGIYSGFESASAGGAPGGGGPPPGGNGGVGPGNAGPTDKDTFLRGIQRTDAHGYCEFETIYPGWYRGRTVHIHVKVHLGGTVVHTGQLYFPDSLTDTVYQTGPYKARAAARDTRNTYDAIYRNGGRQSMLALKRTNKGGKGGYTGAITLGIR